VSTNLELRTADEENKKKCILEKKGQMDVYNTQICNPQGKARPCPLSLSLSLSRRLLRTHAHTLARGSKRWARTQTAWGACGPK
jgi:hypothetical protein